LILLALKIREKYLFFIRYWRNRG